MFWEKGEIISKEVQETVVLGLRSRDSQRFLIPYCRRELLLETAAQPETILPAPTSHLEGAMFLSGGQGA